MMIVAGRMARDTLLVELPVADRLVVVAGHGPDAAALTAALLERGARVRVAAGDRTELTPSLADLAARGRVMLVARSCTSADLADAWLVYPRTGDPAEDLRIADEARRARVWCVPANRAANGRATNGNGHRPDAAGTVGAVTIVGGGPGDPELITVRGLRALGAADVVVHDRLAPLALLADLPATTTLIDAAKLPGGTAMPQAEINRQLIEHARLGLRVVRLKGGDPFVFGRGMEEVDACRAAGIPVTVVPGVTSATAVPGLAGITLTHRGLAHAFTVVSGHLAPNSDRSRLDWAAMARSGATLVLLMAVETLPTITESLLAAGMDPNTPAATVQEGGTPRQTMVRSVLGRLVADTARVRPPAVTVIGPAVAHRAEPDETVPGGGRRAAAGRRA
jgi:uroporphyrin-III C-methyltransferase